MLALNAQKTSLEKNGINFESVVKALKMRHCQPISGTSKKITSVFQQHSLQRKFIFVFNGIEIALAATILQYVFINVY
ncbi:Competence-stimulating peptide type [Dirofilaria immitis]